MIRALRRRLRAWGITRRLERMEQMWDRTPRAERRRAERLGRHRSPSKGGRRAATR